MAEQLSASDLVEQAQSLVDEIPKAAIAECREMLGARIADMDEKDVLSCMNYPPPPGWEVTPEFLDGLRFAAELVRDKDFDY